MSAHVPVLVTDGELNAALAVVRSLGRSGHQVYVCSSRARSLAGASRYARAEHQVTHPLENPEQHAADLRALVQRWNVRVLLPISEASLLAVLAQRATFGDIVIPFPALSDFQRACDKAFVADVAAHVGVPVPAQRLLREPRALADGAALPAGFPLVVKPTRSVSGNGAARHKNSVRHAESADALRRIVSALPADAFPLLLQQRIVGPGVGVFLLRWDGEIRAAFCHQRLREKPPSGGVSVYSESVPPNESLIELSSELLRRLNWQGVAMVEYKVDAATGKPYLMEINGRFWGSLQLAIDAGVDFPALLVRNALGERTTADGYRTGVRTRWWWGDVDHLLARVRRSREELSLPPDAPGLAHTVGKFLATSVQSHRDAVFRIDDPAPSWREAIDWFKRT